MAASCHRARLPHASYYAKLGRTLEEGCFDMMFFDDRLAMPGIYGGSVAEAVQLGARPVKLDLSIVLGVVAGATDRIGLGATYSTTYYSPFHVARTFATLDHLSGGRAAWNVVTSVNDSEAQNYGLKEHLDHDARYDRADEFLEATTGLWDTWDDDALMLDRASGYFADPDKVHELDYEGKWFSVRGPLTVPRSSQGRPVLLQAGSSGRGRDFAARWAELVFSGDPTSISPGRTTRTRRRPSPPPDAIPNRSRCSPWSTRWSASPTAHAEEREQLFLNDLVDPLASLTLLSELMNYDFSGMELDDPITDELIESVSGIRGLVQNLRTHIGGADHAGRPGRAPGHLAPGPPLRRHRIPRWPTRWSSGSKLTPATGSSSRPPTARGPTRTWSAWSCPSSSAAACSVTAMREPPCATHSAATSARARCEGRSTIPT
jgi:FMN-dependent oxidoreductase (nitrilotriacetate monooxygenase family)